MHTGYDKWVFLITASLLSVLGDYNTAQSQNLVPNPSFEEYSKLFYNFIQTKEDFNSSVKYWKMPTIGTPDIFSNLVDQTNSNHPHSTANITTGNQDPRDGDFMIGLFTKAIIPNYREYVQVSLLQPLIPNKTYLAGFYMSLADNMQYASNNIGMLFTEDSVESMDFKPLLYPPQINSSNIIEEKNNWVFFSSTFTATEAFSYLTIGNFYSDENTKVKKVSDVVKISSDNTYYFIDSVFVEPINELIIPNVFTPNGDEFNQTFFIKNLQPDRWEITISNRWGQEVFRSRYYHNQWDGSGLKPGIYYYIIKYRYADIEYRGIVHILL